MTTASDSIFRKTVRVEYYGDILFYTARLTAPFQFSEKKNNNKLLLKENYSRRREHNRPFPDMTIYSAGNTATSVVSI